MDDRECCLCSHAGTHYEKDVSPRVFYCGRHSAKQARMGCHMLQVPWPVKKRLPIIDLVQALHRAGPTGTSDAPRLVSALAAQGVSDGVIGRVIDAVLAARDDAELRLIVTSLDLPEGS